MLGVVRLKQVSMHFFDQDRVIVALLAAEMSDLRQIADEGSGMLVSHERAQRFFGRVANLRYPIVGADQQLGDCLVRIELCQCRHGLFPNMPIPVSRQFNWR
jgi:hypothetical protein